MGKAGEYDCAHNVPYDENCPKCETESDPLKQAVKELIAARAVYNETFFAAKASNNEMKKATHDLEVAWNKVVQLVQ